MSSRGERAAAHTRRRDRRDVVARTGTRAHSRAPHQISIALPRPISDHLGFAPEHLPAPHRYPELEARRRGFAPLFLGRLERFFFFKQKTAYEIRLSLVGSEMCIRDSVGVELKGVSRS